MRKKPQAAGRAPRRQKDEERPAPRKPDVERTLCGAIRDRRLVLIFYKDEFSARLFAPHAVYRSTAEKIDVSGTQLENPAQPLDNNQPRIFEVGKIRSMTPTNHHFRPDPRFDRFDPRYKNGVICSVNAVNVS